MRPQSQESDLGGQERAQLLANMGALYRNLGDPYKAVRSYAEAEQLAAQLGDVSSRMSIGINRGIALALDLNQLDQAEAAFQEVLTPAAEIGARRERLHATLYLAETRRRMDRPAEADKGFEAALAEAEELGLTEERWKALFGLGRIAEKGRSG